MGFAVTKATQNKIMNGKIRLPVAHLDLLVKKTINLISLQQVSGFIRPKITRANARARSARARALRARAQPWPRRRRVRVKMVRILYMNRAPKARTRVESRAGSRACARARSLHLRESWVCKNL